MLFTKNKEGDKKMVGLMDKTLKGLLATAIEKVCVLGPEDAKEDLKKLRNMTEEIVAFWNMDEKYIHEFDEKIPILK